MMIQRKKSGLLSLLLVLALLAGCAPAVDAPAPFPTAAASPSPRPTPTPTPEPTPAPEPVDFREFLDGVNARRRAVIEQEEPIDISPYTPDFYEQNQTFTEAELERLTTQHGPEENLTKDGLLSDADTFFTLLQTTYGAYYYFGGDETFFPIRDAVREELAAMEAPTVQDLNDVLYRHLYPVLVDGHFTLGNYAMGIPHIQYMYYVPGVYLDSLDGVEDPGYLKPTIGPDGRICYWYAAMSHDGGDLPSRLDGRALLWRRAGRLSLNWQAQIFDESEWKGVPILVSRSMSARDGATGPIIPEREEVLEKLAACGGEYAGSPLLIFDVRGNGGGDDSYIRNWFQGWAGNRARYPGGFSYRYSQLSCHIYNFYPVDRMGTYRVYLQTGAWVERTGPVFVLQDKGVASSGESLVEIFQTAADTLLVGGPTTGCSLTPNNWGFFLPHSGLRCYFGTGLALHGAGENLDGVGYLPDLWVEPSKALDAVKRLIEYYGLNTAQ